MIREAISVVSEGSHFFMGSNSFSMVVESARIVEDIFQIPRGTLRVFEDDTRGLCIVCIPKALLNEATRFNWLSVVINDDYAEVTIKHPSGSGIPDRKGRWTFVAKGEGAKYGQLLSFLGTYGLFGAPCLPAS